jgi:hypothetical protein
VREEKMPSVIAPEAIQRQERFVTGLGPKLAGTFEATLILAAGRLDGAAAHGFIALTRITIVKAAAVVFDVADCALQVRTRLSAQALECLAQLVEQPRGLVGFELPQQGYNPLRGRGRARSVQGLGDRPQVLFGVIEVEALPGFGKRSLTRFHIHTAPSATTSTSAARLSPCRLASANNWLRNSSIPPRVMTYPRLRIIGLPASLRNL